MDDGGTIEETTAMYDEGLCWLKCKAEVVVKLNSFLIVTYCVKVVIFVT